MSSELLQQAMIDATALKEAAMKNAENTLIEKYSQEFNLTVQKLLEQEEPAAVPQDAAAMPPVANIPPAAPEEAGAPDLSAAAVDPMADMSSGMPVDDRAFIKVPGAFSGADDNEMITVNFDQIKAALNEMLNVRIKEENDTGLEQDVTNDALAAGEPDITIKMGGALESGDDELDLDLDEEGGMAGSDEIMGANGVHELEEVELEEETINPAIIAAQEAVGQSEQQLANAKGKLAALTAKASTAELEKQQQAALSTASPATMEEDITLSEEELQELAEDLKVDLDVDNMSDGYMGTTTTQKREQRAVELAAARDAQATEDRKVEKEKMIDLMKESAQLKKMGNETLETVHMLKEQLEKMNIQNAKLLYTNKALGNISLNERQKQNIVESISRADSVLAAKTIYETVQNAVENTKKEPTAPQSLRETLNRAASPFVVRKAVNSTDSAAERLKALAGITKSNKLS